MMCGDLDKTLTTSAGVEAAVVLGPSVLLEANTVLETGMVDEAKTVVETCEEDKKVLETGASVAEDSLQTPFLFFMSSI